MAGVCHRCATGMAASFKTAAAGGGRIAGMDTPDIDAAARFLAPGGGGGGRRPFGRLFAGGDARAVRDAVAAYRNDDGGFGHALEPDGRCPGSQPAAVAMALSIMNETGAWDEDLVRGACDWLAAVAPAGGGAAFGQAALGGWGPR